MKGCYRKGDVYYVNLNNCIGCEQGRMRPVLLLSNLRGTTVVVAVLSTKIEKKKEQVHCFVKACGKMKDSIVLLEQIRTIDIVRLKRYLCTLSDSKMKEVEKKILNVFDI